MGQKSQFKKIDRNAISQKDINNVFLGKLPDGLKTRVSDNIRAQDEHMSRMLKGFAESFNGLDFKTEPQASDREIGYFFVQGFLTIDMRLDFFAIANDFFINCPGICKTFNAQTLIGDSKGNSSFRVKCDDLKAGNIKVTVPNSLLYKQAGKTDITAAITAKSGNNTITPTNKVCVYDIATTNGLSAGCWQGSFNIGLTLTKE